MIDFHNHILPGADDGAKTMKDSIEMLKYAQKQGITDVVNTVHFQHPKMEGKNTDFEFIYRLKEDLLKEMAKNNIEINIHLGAEVFFDFNLMSILDNPLITFCNGKYMLVEFQTYMMPKGFENHLYELKISGVTPIIAHPERYKPIQDDIKIIEQLINSGCLIQIDAGSLIGHFGKNCKLVAETMLRRNMVHLVGSDAHGRGKRNFCLKDSVVIMKNFISEKLINTILDNSRKVISGQEIEPFNIIDIKESWFSDKILKFFQK